jgi:hypothetical protein
MNSYIQINADRFWAAYLKMTPLQQKTLWADFPALKNLMDDPRLPLLLSISPSNAAAA